MTLDELRARSLAIAEELRTIHTEAGDEPLTEEQDARFSELSDEYDTVTANIAEVEARHARIARLAQAGTVESGADNDDTTGVSASRAVQDPYDLSEVRTFGRSTRQITAELRSRAETAVEQTFIDDAGKERATELLRNDDPRGTIAQLILATGTDDYHSAFMRGLSGRQHEWTPEERQAVARAEETRAALSLTDANGGYAVPFTLDPTLILANSGSINPIRRVARNVTITTDSWNGLSSAGMTAAYGAEVAEVADGSPTFAQPSVPVHLGKAFAQASIPISQDYQAIASDLMTMFADARDNLDATMFVTGSGTNQPTGIVTALTGGSSVVAPGTPETFAVGDVYKLAQELPPRYRGNAGWLFELSTMNAIRQFATDDGHALLARLGEGDVTQLLGKPAYESSALDPAADIDASATETNNILVYGDWSKYLVVDRVGMAVEFIPHLFNTANNLPDGRRGWFMHWRTGADSLVDAAFRMLSIPTTA